jgi:protein-arginine kinase activator protein McsA
MPICQFCHAPADAVVNRRHPHEGWEVRLHVCESCLCSRLPVLNEEDIVEESVAPVWVSTVVAFSPMPPVHFGALTG